jgi:hypothetical protein
MNSTNNYPSPSKLYTFYDGVLAKRHLKEETVDASTCIKPQSTGQSKKTASPFVTMHADTPQVVAAAVSFGPASTRAFQSDSAAISLANDKSQYDISRKALSRANGARSFREEEKSSRLHIDMELLIQDRFGK